MIGAAVASCQHCSLLTVFIPADVQSTVSRDLLGLQQISRTFSIIDLERADPRLPPRARQRSERYKQRPSAIDPDLTVYEVRAKG